MREKGIVMEKRRRYMIVLTESGIFQKAAPMKHTVVGGEVYFRPAVSHKWPSFFFYPQKSSQVPATLITMCCLLLVLIIPFYFTTGR